MKKGRFLWSAHRITERQKAGKVRSIKGKQLKNSRSSRTYPLAWNVVQTVSSSVTAFIPDMSTWSASHFLLVLYMQLVASHEMDKESLGRWHILVAPGF